MPELIPINPAAPEPELIRRACDLLNAGKLIVVPTETVYGIAAAPEFIEKLYAAKERDRGKPIAKLAAGIEQVEKTGAVFTEPARKLARKFWPGPLTLILETPDGTTGFRVPAHQVPLALVREFGRPILLTSANKSGGADAITAQQALETLADAVALYLDAGITSEKTPSTVIHCTAGSIKLLRPGALSEEQIRRVLV